MRLHFSALALVPLLAVSVPAAAKVCPDGKTYRASQPCPAKKSSNNRPTFRELPTDKLNPAYRANLTAFRQQAVADRRAGTLTQAQFDRKIAQFDKAMAELNAR